ncbi:MAG: type II secretion system protein J [bacterium]
MKKPGENVMRRRRNAGGFTLIELLVAMGVLSIILLSVYGTFFSVNRALEASDRSMLRLREVRVFFDILRREIESAYINTGSDENGTFFSVKDRDIFGKKISQVGFTSFAPYGSGLYTVEYFVDSGKRSLLKAADSFFSDKRSEAIEALEDVDEFQVEVYTAGKWVGTYDSQRTRKLPPAVRVTITFTIKDIPMTFRETMEPKLRS